MSINRKLAINSKWILLGILFVVIISMFFVVNNKGFIGKILHYFGVYTEEINIVQVMDIKIILLGLGMLLSLQNGQAQKLLRLPLK